MRSVEPRSQTLHGCYVLLKHLEETLSHVYSGAHSNLISYHGYGDPLLAVYQPGLLDNINRYVSYILRELLFKQRQTAVQLHTMGDANQF